MEIVRLDITKIYKLHLLNAIKLTKIHSNIKILRDKNNTHKKPVTYEDYHNDSRGDCDCCLCTCNILSYCYSFIFTVFPDYLHTLLVNEICAASVSCILKCFLVVKIQRNTNLC